jgi:hypothetical protein
MKATDIVRMWLVPTVIERSFAEGHHALRNRRIEGVVGLGKETSHLGRNALNPDTTMKTNKTTADCNKMMSETAISSEGIR